MGQLGMLLAVAVVAPLIAACSRDTAIVVEVTWDQATLDPSADALRIYVGTATSDPDAFATNPGTQAIALADLEPPYRYLLRPGGDLDAIGGLELAAAITGGSDAQPLAFAPSPTPIEFADGEVRTIALAPIARPFAVSGDAAECVTWAAAGAGPLDRAIGTDGDNDCDARVNAEDCQPFNPRITGDNLDGDGAICDDCLDGATPVMLGGWSIDPGTVFPGQTEQQFRLDNAIPDGVACIHIDYDCSGTCGGGNGGPGDQDGSHSDRCGSTVPGSEPLVCTTRPADCNENIPGHTPMFGEAEVCDGRDESCDDRLSPNLPCPLFGPSACTVGQRVCDDARGAFGECAPIGFTHPLDTETCGILDRVAGCEDDDDPLRCAAGMRDTCAVGLTGAGCPDERTRLPGLAGEVTCQWRVVGGVDHAEWVIGFADAADSTAPVREMTTTCAPFLVVRAVHAQPTPRTVMIIGQDPTATSTFARFVTFSIDDNASCDRVLICSAFN